MRFVNFLAVGVFGWVATIGCGGSDSGGSGASSTTTICTNICNCVAPPDAAGRTDCMNQCTTLANGGGDKVATCEQQLTSKGYPNCVSVCQQFAAPAPQASCYLSSDNQDSDCVAMNKPREIKCPDASHQAAYLGQGCATKKQGSTDVCCPLTVYAPPKPAGAGGASGTGGFEGVGGYVGMGGFGVAGSNTGGFNQGSGGETAAGGFIGVAGSFGNGGYVSSGGFTSSGGFIGGAGGSSSTCSTTWLNDCTSNAQCDASCGLTCVQVCSACTPNCGHNCASDADCTGQSIDGLATPYCFRLDAAWDGWCSSSAN